MANAAGVDQSGLSGIRNNYSAMSNGNNTRDRLMEQQYNPYTMPVFANGGQRPELGRYRPPMMGPNGGWQDQGGYSYNLPNSFGPYYGAPMSGYFGGGGMPPWLQNPYTEAPRPQPNSIPGARPKPLPIGPGAGFGGSISLPPPTQRPMTVGPPGGMFGGAGVPAGQAALTGSMVPNNALRSMLQRQQLAGNMPIFGR
jgi:hypothetical protein